MSEPGTQVSGVASLATIQPTFCWTDAEGNPTAERVTECHLYFDRITEGEEEGFQCDLHLYADEGGCLSTAERTGSAAHLVRGAEYACHYSFEEKDPGSIEDEECQVVRATDTVHLRRRYRLKLELGDLDQIFADGDEGRRQKLQALGFYYEPTDDTSDGRDVAFEKCLDYWKRLRGVPEETSGEELDELLTAHLRRFLCQPEPENPEEEDVSLEPPLVGEDPRPEAEGDEEPPPGSGVDLTDGTRRIYVPGGFTVREQSWLAGRTPHRWETEGAMHERNPALGRLPIVATLEKHVDGSWEPEEGTDVYFQLVRPSPDDPVAEHGWWEALPSESPVRHSVGGVRDYVGVHSCHDFDPADPQRFNLHADWGGFRKKDGVVATNPSDPNVFCGYEVGSFPWTAADATSDHDHAVKVTTDADGHAGACLHARFAGDRYRVRAFVDPGEAGESDGTDPGAIVAETGDLTVWRHVLISRYYQRPVLGLEDAHLQEYVGTSLPTIDFEVVAEEFRQHFVRVEVRPEARSPVPIAAGSYRQAVREAREWVQNEASRPGYVIEALDVEALITDRWQHPYMLQVADSRTYNESLEAGQDAMAAGVGDANWWRWATWACEEVQRHILRQVTGGWVPGLVIIQALSGDNVSDATIINTSGGDFSRVIVAPPWAPPEDEEDGESADEASTYEPPSSSGRAWAGTRGVYIFLGDAAYDTSREYVPGERMPYDASRNAIHELGHQLMLRHHWEGIDLETGAPSGGIPLDHDYADRCVMGYLPTPGHLCGKCHFKLRGANDRDMPLNRDKDAWTGLDRVMATNLTLAAPGEEEGTAPPLELESGSESEAAEDEGDGRGPPLGVPFDGARDLTEQLAEAVERAAEVTWDEEGEYLIGGEADHPIRFPDEETASQEIVRVGHFMDEEGEVHVHRELVEGVVALAEEFSIADPEADDFDFQVIGGPQVPDPPCPDIQFSHLAHGEEIEADFGYDEGDASDAGLSAAAATAFIRKLNEENEGGDALHLRIPDVDLTWHTRNNNEEARKIIAMAIWGKSEQEDGSESLLRILHHEKDGAFGGCHVIVYREHVRPGSRGDVFVHFHRTDDEETRLLSRVDLVDLPEFLDREDGLGDFFWIDDDDHEDPVELDARWNEEDSFPTIWRHLSDELTPEEEYVLFKVNDTEDRGESYADQWGTPLLVDILGGLARDYTANTATEEEPEGLLLGIGDLSPVFGGDIPGHGSHDHGFDVDIYFLLEEDGEYVNYYSFELPAGVDEFGDYDFWYSREEGGGDRDEWATQEVGERLKEIRRVAFDYLDGRDEVYKVVGHDDDIMHDYDGTFGGKSYTHPPDEGWPYHYDHIHFRMCYNHAEPYEEGGD